VLGLSKEANHAVGIFVGILINRNRESQVFIRVLRLDMNDPLRQQFPYKIGFFEPPGPASQPAFCCPVPGSSP